MSVKRSPMFEAFGPTSGLCPVRFRWSLMTMSVPGPKLGSSPPAALVSTTTFAPSRPNSSTGWTTRPGALPSYRWNRPWSIATGRPPRRPSSSRPTWPGAVAAGQPGRSANGIATGSSSSSARPPNPDPSTIPTSGTRSLTGPDGGLEGVEARRLVGRGDRRGRGGHVTQGRGARNRCRRISGKRASRATSRGRRPVARKLLRARREYRHRDAGRVPPGSPGDGAGTPSRPGTEAPEATGPGSRSLM